MPKPLFFTRKFIVLCVTIPAIIAVLVLGIYYSGKFFAEDILNQIVQKETNGVYQLNFETVDVDLLEKQIRVNNLVLRLDSTRDITVLDANNIYEISLETLIIDLESIFPFYFDKELVITNVRVVDPEIEMVSLKSDNKTAFSLEAGNMYQAISDYLKVLKIDYFRIQDGELNYDNNKFSLGSINFKINDLKLDSVTRSDKVFYSENIELEVKNQHFLMPDSVHEITFDRFLLSTRDSILVFENLRINPLPRSSVDFEGDNDINVYEIEVPKLALKGIDYLEAYQNNHLKIEELILDQARISVDDESHARKVNEEMDNSLLTQIFKVFGAMDIGKLKINDAYVDLKIDGQKNYQRFKSEKSNITFYNIHLDTSNYRFDHRFEYFEDIEIDIQNYTYLLPDSVHTLHFDLLHINSFDSEIKLKNSRISHERAGNETKFLMNMEMPLFEMKYIDFRSAIASKILNVGKLTIPELYADIKNDGISEKKELLSVEDFYTSLSPYFKEVMIDKLEIADVDLGLPKGLRIAEIDMNMRDVHISAGKRAYSEMFGYSQVNASGFELNQDSIRIRGDRLYANQHLTDFTLMGWEVLIDQNNQKLNSRFDSVRISEVHFDSLLLSNYSSFKRIFINKPDINFNFPSNDNDSSKFNPGIEKEVIISNGRIEGNVGDDALFIENLNADVFIGDSSAFRKVDISGASLRSKSLNHTIEISSWSYDTLDGRMEFSELSIKPIDLNDTSRSLITAEIPFLFLRSFEQAQFFDEKHLSASLIRLAQPDIQIKMPAQKQDSMSRQAGYTVSIDQFQLDTGNLSVSMAGQSLDRIVARGVTSSFFGISYPQNDPFAGNRIFYADSVDFRMSSIQPFLASGDAFYTGEIVYRSQGSRLKVDSMRYRAANKSMDFLVPRMQIDELDIKSLYNNAGIKSNAITLLHPQGVSFASSDPKVGASFEEHISIGQITIEDLNWTYKDTLNERDLTFRQANIMVQGLLSEDSITARDFHKHVDSFTFDAVALNIPIDAPYTLALGSYRYDYPLNALQINDLELIPKYSSTEYSSIIEEQKDWFDVSVGTFKIERVALDKWISGECYEVGTITLDGVDALIYRDKDVPFPEDQVINLPQESLRKVSAPFQIDTLFLKGRIRYQEKPDDYYTHGEISFDDLDAQLTNVSNYQLAENEMMGLEATGNLMEVGSFEVQGAFNMTDDKEPFSLRGIVRDFPLDSMNQMLGPVANVNIKSGYTKDLVFNFKADNTYANGEMRMRYRDLKVQILNAKTHDKKGLGQGIKTFFANTFVVKNKNPSFLLFLRKGTIFYERDTTRAIFNYWGKALLSGTISSIGVHKADKARKQFARNEENELELKEDDIEDSSR